MANRSILLTAALFLVFAPGAQAGYALAKPPPGWSTGPNGTPLFKPVGPMPTTSANGTMKAANDMSYGPGGVRGTTTVTLDKDVSIPYAFKFAATAGAAAVTMLAKNPAVLLLSYAAPEIIKWLNTGSDEYKSEGGDIYKKYLNTDLICPSSGGVMYQECHFEGGSFEPIPSNGCVSQVFQNGSSQGGGTVQYCRVISFKTEAPTVDWQVIPKSDWATALPKLPPTPQLPFVLPEPLPVDVPVINPSPLPLDQPWPGVDPKPLPMKVPQSDPVPVPDTNPQEYRQPWTVIEPSPTVSSPWRVNMRPGETITTDPTPQTGPVTDPPPVPDPVTGELPSNTPSPDTSDFCAANPGVVACLKKGDPGTLDPLPLYNEDKDVSQINKVDGFGPASGTCPAGQTLNIGGTSLQLGYDRICEFATMINPLVIGFAWLSAAFTFFGFARKD